MINYLVQQVAYTAWGVLLGAAVAACALLLGARERR